MQRLFEQEIPEIADGVIRNPGDGPRAGLPLEGGRQLSSDPRVDCVGACVGVRGNRIKNIVDELGGERIDIVRWDDNLEVLIPNALQPAEVEQVILCKMLGRAIVLVREDQLSLAIGRRGQNVRLASKLSGWDIEIMTQEELAEAIDRAVEGFSSIDGRRRGAGRAARRRRLPELRRPVDHRARCPDGDGRAVAKRKSTRSSSRPKSEADRSRSGRAEARRQKREEDRLAAIEAEYAAAEAAAARRDADGGGADAPASEAAEAMKLTTSRRGEDAGGSGGRRRRRRDGGRTAGAAS